MAETTDASVYDVKVNDLVSPIGIDTKTPAFSWKIASDNLGAKQTAYLVTVTDENEAEVWNTGWVESDKSQGIVYGGSDLKSSTKYTVSVAIKDETGTATPTVYTTFETALLEDDAFSDTKWISYQNTADESDKKPALNPDLWDELLRLCDRHTLTINWIKGHAGNIENERCDALAVMQSKKSSSL